MPRDVEERFDAKLELLLQGRVAGREHARQRLGEVTVVPPLLALELEQRRSQLIVKRRLPPLGREEQPDETEARVSRLHPAAELVAAAPGLERAKEAVQIAVVELVEVVPCTCRPRVDDDRRDERRDLTIRVGDDPALTNIGV